MSHAEPAVSAAGILFLTACNTSLIVNVLDRQQNCRYEDKFFERLCERLDEVITMRETHAELLDLLGTNSLDHAVSFYLLALAALP